MADVYRTCEACGGEWFAVVERFKLPANTAFPTAPGARPVTLDLNVTLKCAGCEAEAA